MDIKQEIQIQKEKMQHDLLCILDGLEDNVLTNVCQVVVDRMNLLLLKLEVEEKYGGWFNRP